MNIEDVKTTVKVDVSGLLVLAPDEQYNVRIGALLCHIQGVAFSARVYPNERGGPDVYVRYFRRGHNVLKNGQPGAEFTGVEFFLPSKNPFPTEADMHLHESVKAEIRALCEAACFEALED